MSTNPAFGPFLTIFGHFCLMGIFPKKSGSVTHNYNGPFTPCKVSEKSNEPIPRKRTDPSGRDRGPKNFMQNRKIIRSLDLENLKGNITGLEYYKFWKTAKPFLQNKVTSKKYWTNIVTHGSGHSRMDQIKFVEDCL